ncbi:MAG: stage II sporulation protein E [Firmicutes bacterium]|nr:stage II sporulation protein E [Bacillota bacterium]
MGHKLKAYISRFSGGLSILRGLGRLLAGWLRSLAGLMLQGRLPLLSLLAYLLGRAPLVPGIYPFGMALLTNALKYQGPLAGLVVLFFAAHGMAARLPSSSLQYWCLTGALTCGAAVLPYSRKLGLGFNGLLVVIAVLAVPPLLLWAPWLVPEFITWLPSLAAVWAIGNLLAPVWDLEGRRSAAPLDYQQLTAVALLLLGAFLGLTGTYIGTVHLQELFGCVMLLMAAQIGGLAAAIVGGMLLGLFTALTSGNLMLMGIWGMFGLLSGLGAQQKKLGISFAFVVANLLLPFFLGSGDELFSVWTMSAAALAVFFLIPLRLLRRLARAIPNTEEQRQNQELTHKRLREMLNQRLDDFARVFDELSATFNQIPHRPTVSDRGYDNYLLSLARKACSDCAGFQTCWESRFHQTYWDMVELLAIAEKNSRIQFADLPEDVVNYCMQPYQLTTSINAVTEMLRLETFWQRLLQESHEVVTNQLEGLSQIMRSFAAQMELEVEFDEEWEIRLKAALRRSRIPVESLRVIRTPGGKPEIHVRMEHCGGVEACRERVAETASQVLGQAYSVWTRECTDMLPRARCQFVLLPERVYNVQIEAVKMAKDGNFISGDTHSQVWLRDGKLAVVLSDGMGYGPRAALESTATIAMLKQLMQAGFDREFAVRTVNSILLLRSTDEAFATVDLAIADLYTGELEFIKVGAAPSFIVRGSRIDVVRSNTLPIGILNTVEMEPQILSWRHGDILLMMTDGIMNGYSGLNEEWLHRVIRRAPNRDLKTVLNLILEEAQAMSGGEVKDDMTVIGVLLRRRAGVGDVVEESGVNEIPVYHRRLA